MTRTRWAGLVVAVFAIACRRTPKAAPDPVASVTARPVPSAAPSPSPAPAPAPTPIPEPPPKPCDPVAALAAHAPAMAAGRTAMAKKDWADAIRELGKAVEAWEGCIDHAAERAQALAERGYAFVMFKRALPASVDLVRAWRIAHSLPDAKLRGAIAYNLGLVGELAEDDTALVWFAVSNDVNPTTAAAGKVERSSCGVVGDAAVVKGGVTTDTCPSGLPPCASVDVAAADSYGDLSMFGHVTALDVDASETWAYSAGRGGVKWRCAGDGESTVSAFSDDDDYLVVSTRSILSGPGASPTGTMGCAPMVDLTSIAVISRKKHARIGLRDTFLKDGKPYCPPT